jgi:hypothetical protein
MVSYLSLTQYMIERLNLDHSFCTSLLILHHSVGYFAALCFHETPGMVV